MRIGVNIYYLTIRPIKPRRNKQDTFLINSLLQTRSTDRKRSTNTTLVTFTTKTRSQNSSEAILKNNNTSNYTRRTTSSEAVKSTMLRKLNTITCQLRNTRLTELKKKY